MDRSAGGTRSFKKRSWVAESLFRIADQEDETQVMKLQENLLVSSQPRSPTLVPKNLFPDPHVLTSQP